MCKRFLADTVANEIVISGQEHIHLANVLRMTEGDHIVATNNDDYDYECEIIKIGKKETKCKLIQKIKNNHNPKKHIDVFHALIKNDKMSLVTQKLSELGISNLVLFESKFQTVKPSENKQEKLLKISEQSSKQCKRSKIMNISGPVTFKSMLEMLTNYDIIIFANETETATLISNYNEAIQHADKIAIIIGSEGGFELSEIKEIIEKGAISVTLGDRILRAETAAIVLTGYISLLINN